MFLFKMCVHGDGSGHDLIKWMQLGATSKLFKDHV
jgi:hypothetical protein